MKDAIVSLVESRKFWLTVLSVCSAAAAYWRHGIDADAFAKIISGSIAVLVLAIAHEDNGTNSAPQNIAATGNVTVQPTVSK